MKQISVRRGRGSDAQSLRRLLDSLAAFEKLEPPGDEAWARMVRDIFEKKKLGLFLAVSGNETVGYALYFYSYSSFLAKPTLYLEDIFVLEGWRGRGAGSSLFRRCAREAVASGCGRMEWAVLTWNKGAMGFYERLGARRLDEWYHYRLEAGRFAAVAGEGRQAGKRPFRNRPLRERTAGGRRRPP